MIILPLVINNVAVNVTINLKNIEVKKNVLSTDNKDADVVLFKTHLKAYEENDKTITDPRAITNFIRKNINYDSNDDKYIEVNTRKYKDSDFCDTYIIPAPNYNANEINDHIYGLLVNNIRLSYPDDIKKSNLSLASLGFDELFNGDFFNRITKIKSNSSNPLFIRDQIKGAGFTKQLEVLDFLNNLDYEIVENSDIILTSELDTMSNFFKKTNKINKYLTNFKNIALSNYDCYMNLAALNSIVNGRNLEWPTLSLEQQKMLSLKMNNARRVA